MFRIRGFWGGDYLFWVRKHFGGKETEPFLFETFQADHTHNQNKIQNKMRMSSSSIIVV